MPGLRTVGFVGGFCALLSPGMPGGVARAEDVLRVATLNLHGYHAMGQPLRWMEHRDGRLEQVSGNPFFFSIQELATGEATRQRELAQLVAELQPDIMAFQEVAAGLPGTQKTCETFQDAARPGAFGTNTVVRLAARPELADYGVALACRGNIGWQTSPDIFWDRRIVVKDSSGPNNGTRTVWDYGANPYPDGLLIEGLALVFRKDWTLVRNEMRQLVVGPNRETFAYQVVALDRGGRLGASRRLLVANIHGGHKVRNFEQAVAVQRDLLTVLQEIQWPLESPRIILGDINEPLVRPSQALDSERSAQGRESVRWFAAAWEGQFPGLFDLQPAASGTGQPTRPTNLVEILAEANDDASYKSWATVVDAANRIGFAWNELLEVHRALALVDPNEPKTLSWMLYEALDGLSRRPGAPSGRYGSAQRIDHIFIPKSASVLDGAVIGESISWTTMSFVSDHPLVWAAVTLPE
jgi:endonuclease/exonuclease/phosphatase family metal-dependent hydrolase